MKNCIFSQSNHVDWIHAHVSFILSQKRRLQRSKLVVKSNFLLLAKLHSLPFPMENNDNNTKMDEILLHFRFVSLTKNVLTFAIVES